MDSKITRRIISGFSILFLFFSYSVVAQVSSPTDHFRSKADGLWEAKNWESSPDGIIWYPATLYPTHISASISISHNVSLNQPIQVDDITVQEWGELSIVTSNAQIKFNTDRPGMIVYGTFHSKTLININAQANTILIKSGGVYVHHLFVDGNHNSELYKCIWEDGSTLTVTDMINPSTNTTFLNGFNQSFYDVNWEGTSQNSYIKIDAESMNIRGDFNLNILTGKILYLTNSSGNKQINIDGDLIIKNRCFIYLSDPSNSSNVNLQINGNVLVGEGTEITKLEIGNKGSGNIIVIKGNLTIASSSFINGHSASVNGTLYFANTFNEQTIINNIGTIKNVNYLLKENACVTAPNLNINTGHTLTLENGASLKTDSQVNGTVKYLTSNADWLASLDGWHLVSSPVSNQLLTGGSFLTAPYDFYAWDEPNNLWLNQKDVTNNITLFQQGKGYFVAYDNGGVKTFSGALNNSDIILTGLTRTGNSSYAGFQLLGNPFPCYLDWNHSSWNKTAVSAVAQIWNEEARNYIPLTADNGLIPPEAGFFVQVTLPTSFTIPKAARTNAVNSTFKDAPSGILRLRITGAVDSTFDETVIRLADDASTGLDAYDGIKLEGSGDAPQIYTALPEGEKLCVNTFATEAYPTVIPIYFRVGAEGDCFIEATLNTMPDDVYLENKSTGSLTLLKKGEKLSLSSSSAYNLHFSALGKPENEISADVVYSSGNKIFFRNLPGHSQYKLYNIVGNLVMSGILGNQSIESINPQVKPGVYIITILNSDMHYSRKIVLN